MKKKLVLMAMLLFAIFFSGFAQNMELGSSGGVNGVKITSYGDGYFVVEVDKIGQCIPLRIVRSTPWWVEVICSDTAKKVTATAVGGGVKWAVEISLAKVENTQRQLTFVTKFLKKYGAPIAQAVARWATKLGHEKLCNYLAGVEFYEVISQPYSW